MIGHEIYELFENSKKAKSEIVLFQSSESIKASPDTADDLFVDVFNHLVARLSNVIGKPIFNDGMAHREYPGWFECKFLAYWEHAGTKYLVLREESNQWCISLGERT